MKSVAPALAILSLIAISGCSSGGGDTPDPIPAVTSSVQFVPNSRANFEALVADATSELTDREVRVLNRGFENTWAYSQVGYGTSVDGITYFAYAGAETQPLNGAIVDTGSIVYDTSYSLYEIRPGASSPEDILSQTGTLRLEANFDDHTIAGTSELFTVNGTLASGTQEFDAEVTWRDIAGEMEGRITDVGVIGAFQGSSDDTVYAGTLFGRPQPE